MFLEKGFSIYDTQNTIFNLVSVLFPDPSDETGAILVLVTDETGAILVLVTDNLTASLPAPVRCVDNN